MNHTLVLVEPSLMSEYFVVVDPHTREASFVAGFGEQSLAVSFAACEREIGRELVVLDSATGEQIYPELHPTKDLPRRHSGMQLFAESSREGGVEDEEAKLD
jgi:hypothetical protein